MAGRLGKFQTKMFSGWAPSISKANHVSAIYQSSPQKATNVMVQLMARNFGKTLDSLLSTFPTKEFESDDEITWDVIGSARRNIPLLEARDISGAVIGEGDTAGADYQRFYLVFGEEYFFKGEVVMGSYNELYPMRIVEDPKKEGINQVCLVELMNGSAKGVPGKALQMGEKFSPEYSPVEKGLSRRVGGVRFVTPASMRNEWSTIRMYHKVSGDLFDKKIAFGIPVVKEDASGKMVKATDTLWMHHVEYAFEKEWSAAKNNVLAYGTSNRNENGEYLNFGDSGEAIRMGDGLYAQIGRGNVYYFNTFSLKLVEEALIALCAGKLDYKDRKFILRTGAYGAMAFNKAVQDKASGWSMFEYSASDLGVVKKTNSPLHANALSAGYQFTEYLAPMGIVLGVEVDNHYDDPVHNKIQHPNGGPASSYRFDILDFGPMDQPNIFKCAVKGKPEYRGYQWGIRNPWTGAMTNTNMSYDEDSASYHRMTTTGICVLDPTRTVSFIPAILAYTE